MEIRENGVKKVISPPWESKYFLYWFEILIQDIYDTSILLTIPMVKTLNYIYTSCSHIIGDDIIDQPKTYIDIMKKFDISDEVREELWFRLSYFDRVFRGMDADTVLRNSQSNILVSEKVEDAIDCLIRRLRKLDLEKSYDELLQLSAIILTRHNKFTIISDEKKPRKKREEPSILRDKEGDFEQDTTSADVIIEEEYDYYDDEDIDTNEYHRKQTVKKPDELEIDEINEEEEEKKRKEREEKGIDLNPLRLRSSSSEDDTRNEEDLWDDNDDECGGDLEYRLDDDNPYLRHFAKDEKKTKKQEEYDFYRGNINRYNRKNLFAAQGNISNIQDLVQKVLNSGINKQVLLSRINFFCNDD